MWWVVDRAANGALGRNRQPAPPLSPGLAYRHQQDPTRQWVVHPGRHRDGHYQYINTFIIRILGSTHGYFVDRDSNHLPILGFHVTNCSVLHQTRDGCFDVPQ